MPKGTRPPAVPAKEDEHQRRLWVVLVALAALAVFAALRLSSAPVVSEAARRVGPVFRLTSITGKAIVLPTGKPTLLYFMAAWCSSCWQGESALAPLWRKLHARAVFLSLDVSPQLDAKTTIAAMAEKTGGSWPHAYATPAILNHYRISYLDTVVVLSPAGQVLYSGPTPGDRELSRLLRAGAS
jgi:hypothetical protein